MADGGALLSFLFYSILVYPIIHWVLGKFRRRGLVIAIGLLVIIAFGKLALDSIDRQPNYYELLRVTRASGVAEIKRAFKRMSLELHPDKNRSPTAASEFNRLKDAHDVLLNAKARAIYDDFGEEAVQGIHPVEDIYQVIFQIGIYYVITGFVAYVLTIGKRMGSARQWVFTALMAMLGIEVSFLVTNSLTLPSWFLPQTTVHEFISLLRDLFPAFMNGCKVIAGFYYVDTELLLHQKIAALQRSNEEVKILLREVVVRLNSTGDNPAIKVPLAEKLQQLEKETSSSDSVTSKGPEKPSQSSGNFWFYALVFGYIVMHFFPTFA